MIYLLSSKENSVVREGASFLANILQFPDGNLNNFGIYYML